MSVADDLQSRLETIGWFDDPNPSFVSGAPGSGRTNLASVLGELCDNRGWETASNIPSDGRETIESDLEALSWALQGSGQRLLIVDETSLHVHPRRMRPVLGKLVAALEDAEVKVVFVVDERPDWFLEWDATCFEASRSEGSVLFAGGGFLLENVPCVINEAAESGYADWVFIEGDSR